jgi:hypothetical protein
MTRKFLTHKQAKKGIKNIKNNPETDALAPAAGRLPIASVHPIW